MTTVPVAVAGPIALIYSGRFLADVENQITPFLQEVDQLARRGVLPVTLEATDKGWRMAIYTARRVAWLYPTKGGDAYNLGHAARRQFRDEDRLLAAALLLRCHNGLIAFPDLRTLNNAVRARQVPQAAIEGDRLWSAWRTVTATQRQPAPPLSAHARYLDLLDQVVEASRQIETDKQDAVPPQDYAKRTATREQRHSARGVYRFHLMGRCELTTDMMVCLGEVPELRGRVIRIDGRQATVRFEPGSDFSRIPDQGTLKVLPSVRVFRTQREAVAQLRRGETRNPRLLENLLAAQFLPYHPAPDDSLKLRRDENQLAAFRRALEVPDLLCVLGPPGAGKTTTIIEVVRACVARGQRVLITSHTHRAVDNVLKDLPSDINVVRIGSEDKIAPKVLAMSSESRAEAVRKEILADSSGYDALCAVRQQTPVLGRYLTNLATLIDRAGSTHDTVLRLDRELVEAMRRTDAPLLAKLDHADRAVAGFRTEVDRQTAALAAAEGRLTTARNRIASGTPLAFMYRWLVSWREGRTFRLNHALSRSRAALARSRSDVVTLRSQVEEAAGRDPHTARLKADRGTAEQALSHLWPDLARLGEHVIQTLRPVVAGPPLPPPTVPGWAQFHQWCMSTLPLVERRVTLLDQWRDRISDLSVDLEREVARYAQVVGATCIGTDTSTLISKLEFDLAIVDEAGQISTPNLLVPLVRSRRALLVGDHKQLPPFLDEDVRRWAAGQAPAAGRSDPDLPLITELLAKSGFELLFPRAPTTNAVWLRTQRRMPEQIASFVSAAFYDGRLRTEHAGSGPHTVFKSPFAMIDTSDRLPAERAETAMAGKRTAIRHGYRNALEADLIVALIAALERYYVDWAVIVPFNAQKELIIERLNATSGVSSHAADNVGTVDSFQGGERDLIIFGFTRSNSQGNIGFLRELRRFNVAITRAKRQLVLVGDLTTLLAAKDDSFRGLMRLMTDHVAAFGDRRPSRELATMLGQHP